MSQTIANKVTNINMDLWLAMEAYTSGLTEEEQLLFWLKVAVILEGS